MNQMKVLFSIKTPFQGIVVGLTLFVLGNSLFNFQSQIVTAILCSIAWIIILYNIFSIHKFYYPLNGIESILFKLYMLLALVMIIRGYTIEYNYQWKSLQGLFNFHFFVPFYILPYLLPLLLIIGIERIEFRTLSKINIIFNILFLIFFVLNIRQLIVDSAKMPLLQDNNDGFDINLPSSISKFFIFTGFFVLCKDFISKKQWWLNLFILFLAIITMAIGARRGGVLMLSLLSLSVIFIYIQSFKGSRKIVGIIIVLIVTFILIGAYSASENTLFRFINERGLEDNRSEVDHSLLSQMNNFELWFGKGLNGRYYYPLLQDDYLNGWRYGSETGFYNLVLKGGYVFAILYILVLLIPALKGIFKSKNTLTKAMGIYIILSLIELYPFGWLQFDLKYFIIWIGVVFCWSPVIRGMTNLEIKKRFF